MDIHKPKPWRGLREFLKEYAIIVVGVLTALAAEQAVEALHWRHLAHLHEEDLRAGAETAALGAISRLSVDGCIRDELHRIGAQLRASGSQWRGLNPNASGDTDAYLPGSLVRATGPWPLQPWDSALNDGSLAHMPRAVVDDYANIYRTDRDAQEAQQLLYVTLPDLTGLAFDQTLSSSDKSRFLAATAKAEQTERLLANMSRSILRWTLRRGVWPAETSIQASLQRLRAQMGPCVRELTRAEANKVAPAADALAGAKG